MASMKMQKAEEYKAVVLLKPQNGATVTIRNVTMPSMRLNRSFSWAGVPSSGSFPSVIGGDSFVLFDHLRRGGFGSKGMVVYDGYNASNQECSWVLAWDAPADTDVSLNKVCVLTGFKFDIDRLIHQEIQMKLDNSGDRSVAPNATTKTTAEATINDKVTNVATVGASFALRMP